MPRATSHSKVMVRARAAPAAAIASHSSGWERHQATVDEIGHVGYCAARCSSPERTLMRWLYPYFGRLFARQTVEISLLTDREKLRARLDRPFNVDELTIGMSNETFLAAHP